MTPTPRTTRAGDQPQRWAARPRVVNWPGRAGLVAQFRHLTGRWPSTTAQDAGEKRLGVWLNQLRTAASTGAKPTPAKRHAIAWLDAHHDGWRGRPGPTDWVGRSIRIGAFRRAAGRWPSSMEIEATTERRLGAWLSGLRASANNGTDLTPSKQQAIAWLDTEHPGWRVDDAAAVDWLARAHRISDFRGEHGRWPSREAQHPGEKRPGAWLRELRKSALATSAIPTRQQQAIAWLDTEHPGWRVDDAAAVDWLPRAHRISDFRGEHGGWPRQTGRGLEGQLGVWLSQLRRSTRVTRFAPTKQAAITWMDTEHPGWRAAESRSIDWLGRAKTIDAFRLEHERWPSRNTGGVIEEPLGAWLEELRKSVGRGIGLTPAKQVAIDWLDGSHPTWRSARGTARG